MDFAPLHKFVSAVLAFRLLLGKQLTCRLPRATSGTLRSELCRGTECVCARERQCGADGDKYQEEKESRSIWGKEVEGPNISGVQMKSVEGETQAKAPVTSL